MENILNFVRSQIVFVGGGNPGAVWEKEFGGDSVSHYILSALRLIHKKDYTPSDLEYLSDAGIENPEEWVNSVHPSFVLAYLFLDNTGITAEFAASFESLAESLLARPELLSADFNEIEIAFTDSGVPQESAQESGYSFGRVVWTGDLVILVDADNTQFRFFFDGSEVLCPFRL